MSVAGKSPVRPLVVGGIAGLILGCIIGLIIGWVVWPVQYVGEAYTYELNEAEKMEYVAAVVDSYNLTGQAQVAQQRFNGWTTEEKVGALAQLFTEYEAQGKTQEAQQVAALTAELQQLEGWDQAVVNQVTGDLAQEYSDQGASDKAQSVLLFASALGASAPPPASVPIQPTATSPEAGVPLAENLTTLAGVCAGLLLVVGLVALVFIFARQRQSAEKALEAESEAVWTDAGPPPLLQKTSSYALGMDNFDESFAIETEDGEWLGECGMGISETLDDGSPRRVAAFEVWLFDKPNTRTVTNVLMSDAAHSSEVLRNKLSSRGEPVLAKPGGTFSLETPALTVQAQVVEMEYGEGTPPYGYFKNLKVVLTAHQKSDAGPSDQIV